MEIIARFSHEKIDHTKNNTPHLVLSLKAPTLDWVAKRPALCVLPVVDLSGSMADTVPGSGGTKLDHVKKSLHKLVDQLQPGDVSGLVTFSSRAKIAVKPQRVTAELKTKLHGEIDRLRADGGTDLCGGVLEALRCIDSLDLGPQYIKRAIMFTDGEPTSGIVDHKQILKLMTDQLGTASVSAFGYGQVGATSFHGMGVSGCDPTFMNEIAQAGKGNYAYIQNSDAALTAFGRELGGLVSTYAQDIKVFVDPQSGHQITKTVTDIKTKVDALGEVTFEVPEILSEETRNFVFDTSISSQHKAFPRLFTIFNIKVTYSTLNEKGERETKSLETKAKIRFVETGEEDKEIVPELNEIVSLAQVVRAQLEAEEKAKAGDFAAARNIMKTAGTTVRTRGLSHTARLADSVASRFDDAAVYASSGGYLRSVSAGATRSYGTTSMDASAAADLGFVAMTNSSMAAYETSFLADEPKPAPHVSPSGNFAIGNPNLILGGTMTGHDFGVGTITGQSPFEPMTTEAWEQALQQVKDAMEAAEATTHEVKPGDPPLTWAQAKPAKKAKKKGK